MGKTWPVLALVAKWLLIPLGLFGVGYYFIAPQIGRIGITPSKPAVTKPNTISASPDDTTASTETPDPAAKHYKGPDVEVTVARGSRVRSSRYSRYSRYTDRSTTSDGIYHNGKGRKRKRKKPKTSNADGPAMPMNDSGGAGATDAGGSAGGTGGGTGLTLTHGNLKNA